MTEREAIEKIHSVYPAGRKNGLENMRALMEKLGSVQNGLRMVHVAGTNGKGSCCAMLERMLREAGYKTGLYSSPYIEVYNERIRLDGVPVSGDVLAALVERAWPAVESCIAEGIAITEFELGTALAFLAFAEAKVDVAIIEVGLGGRLDPTNIITPLASVITCVGMDHMGLLGHTLGEIALEKAGIIKTGVPVSLGAQEKDALDVLLGAAEGRGSKVYRLKALNVRQARESILFDTQIAGEPAEDIAISLCGMHQADNACAALGAVEALRAQGFDIALPAIRAALQDVHWPGRLEHFGQIILDGAHNDPGVRALCAYCDQWLPAEKTVLLAGMMADKETERMAAQLAPRVSCVVTTQPAVPRAMEAQTLAQVFDAHGTRTYAKPDVAEALAFARSLAGPEGIVLCAGSLYLIGAVRALLRKEKEFAHVI